MLSRLKFHQMWRPLIATSLLAIMPHTIHAADYTIKADGTSQTIFVTLYAGGDPASSNPPGPITGVAYNNANLKAYYIRPGDSLQPITLQTQSVAGGYASGGWVELSSTNAPGRYRLDIPNAVVASGKPHARILVSYSNGSFNVVDDIAIDLIGYDPTAANLPANVTQISGDAAAADNLETMLDGTGGQALSLGQLIVNYSGAGAAVAVGSADGAAIALGGTTAGLEVMASSGSAILLQSTGNNGHGLHIIGNGTGAGISVTGGGAGHGLTLQGGASGDDLLLASSDAPTALFGLFNGAITNAKFGTGAIDANALSSDAASEIIAQNSGTADSGTTTTLVDAALNQSDTDYWTGSWLLVTSGNTAGQIRRISAFNPATDTLTFDRPFTQAISTNGYMILRTGGSDANVTRWLGTGVTTNVGGVPKVDVTHVLGSPVCD